MKKQKTKSTGSGPLPDVIKPPVMPMAELPTGVYEISRRPTGVALNEAVTVAYVDSDWELKRERWFLPVGRQVGLFDPLLPALAEGERYHFKPAPVGFTLPPPDYFEARRLVLAVQSAGSDQLPPPTTMGMSFSRAYSVHTIDDPPAVSHYIVFAANGTEMIATRTGYAFPPAPPFDLVPLDASMIGSLRQVTSVHFASAQSDEG